MANACYQNMFIMHDADCLLKDKEMEEAVIDVEPMCMVKAYNEEYLEISGSGASSVHKFIKMSLRLR